MDLRDRAQIETILRRAREAERQLCIRAAKQAAFIEAPYQYEREILDRIIAALEAIRDPKA